MSQFDYTFFHERHLPHYHPEGATLFITFRLAGSLPIEVIRRMKEESTSEIAKLTRIIDGEGQENAIRSLRKRFYGRYDLELDSSSFGPTWLALPDIAQIVCEALHYRDTHVFTLEAYCVMPNHVHLLCTPLPCKTGYISIASIMHSLKGHTARQANLKLGRQGDFWQHESYDHVVRDSAELDRIVKYVLANPVRAGLTHKWTYAKGSW